MSVRISEVEKPITGWADFLAEERLKYPEKSETLTDANEKFAQGELNDRKQILMAAP